MVRLAKPSDPKRIEELKEKIRNKVYVQEAIRKIAQQLSNEIVHNRD
jgi:hypothetical protein